MIHRPRPLPVTLTAIVGLAALAGCSSPKSATFAPTLPAVATFRPATQETVVTIANPETNTITAGQGFSPVAVVDMPTTIGPDGIERSALPSLLPSHYLAFTDGDYEIAAIDPGVVENIWWRTSVPYDGSEAPGTIVIDTKARYLYLVQEGGEALRYGIGVGREGFSWSGTAKIGRRAQWPTWTPPKEMIARDPDTAKYASGMPGGPGNPLGARALYLFDNGKDTLYRIHGTSEPWSIGRAVSSGCIRMLNHDVIDLFGRVPDGATVVVR